MCQPARMTRTSRVRRGPALRSLLVVFVALTAGVTGLSSAGASAPRAADWHGSAQAKPSAYRWLNDYRPSDTYNISIIRGLTVKQVRHRLGIVRQRLGLMRPKPAENFALDHATRFYETPTIVQIQRLGHAVVVYQPMGSDRTFFRAARISKHALLASFITDVELDTYVEVARNGKVIRQFDSGFRPPRRGALPQEKGLPFGSLKVDIWDTSWAFLERVTLTHISHEWFTTRHPTYWMWGRLH
jgi:hypothetical protein